jgi:hypothetical protein
MKILLCIDDTDNLESRGTGHLAALLVAEMEKNKWGKGTFITRHQLFVHPDVPYTSHNSAMCFMADLEDSFLGTFIAHASNFLVKESAAGSDPGLCVAPVDRLNKTGQIVDFGLRAKAQVLTKSDAYRLARELGIHLSEHGGTGGGVIGALAGVGLRFSGNDGRVRGKLIIDGLNGVAKVREIRSQTQVETVKTLSGKILEDGIRIRLGEKIKAIFQERNPVLLVSSLEPAVDGVSWRTCTKQELSGY